MRVSRATGYGLLAVGYIAQHQDEKLIVSQTISKQYKIPLEYLLKIMQYLVKADILRSKRGTGGGYSLARSASQITMLDVIEAVEGSMDRSLGLTDHTKGRFSSKAEQAYDKVIAQSRAAFQKVKVSDLI